MKNRNQLIALMLFCASTQSGINEDLNKFFQQLDSGNGGNVTQAAAWQGQAAGYLTGGSLFLRNPVRQIQLISVTLPEVKSGCGGIDAYLGSFSFINSDQIKVMAKQILSNAAGYAFDLALETALPQVKAVKDYLQKLATDINNTNISPPVRRHKALSVDCGQKIRPTPNIFVRISPAITVFLLIGQRPVRVVAWAMKPIKYSTTPMTKRKSASRAIVI